MLKNFFKLFLRNIKNHPVISTINFAGLVLGITSTLLIYEYVHYERSFESQHQHADDIYRVAYNRYQGNKLLWKTANSFNPTGDYFKSKFPEVTGYFQLGRNYNIEISCTDAVGNKKSFFEEKTYYASPSIFSILTIELVQGTDSCLTSPNSVAISERAAQKYFGKENPLGKEIKVNTSQVFFVTGVYKTMPSNTHIKSDFLFSYENIYGRSPQLKTSWRNDYGHTYLQLKPGTNFKVLEQKAFARMISENYGEVLKSSNMRDDYYLQPIKDIHLNSAIEYETEPPGSGKAISILFGFSLFFLIIAWVNYINLVTARAVERAKEIGIKKVNGSNRRIIMGQFIFEALLFNLVCLVISLWLVLLLNPLFRYITGIPDLTFPTGTGFWIAGLVIFMSGIVLSSFYPAIIMSSFKPMLVLKGKFKNTSQGIFLRRGLVAFQFFVSISLLVGTGVIYDQVKFLMHKNPGFDATSVLIIKAPRTSEKDSIYQNKISLFRNELQKYPEIQGFTFVSDIPGQEINNFFSCYRKGYSANDKNGYFRTDIDKDFLDLFKIKLLSGRNFNASDLPNQRKVLVNVKALERVGFRNPQEAAGQFVIDGRQREFEIIGVIDDVNYYSTKVEPIPTFYTLTERTKIYMAIKYHGSTAQIPSIIAQIKPEYSGIFPGNAFEYMFLDEKMAVNLVPDKTFAYVFGIFSVLAIIIGVIGILGLVLITINQNMKELGVRKVLGAEYLDINMLLGRQLIWQLVVATGLAVPFSVYALQNRVLNNYVYHISVNWIHLAVPILIIAIVFAIVILSLTKRAYRINVSEVLKSE